MGRVAHNIYSNISLGVETKPLTFSHTLPLRSSITLSFEVVCVENYYGRDCTQFCRENCTCEPGFTGEFCHEINDCYGVDCGENRHCIDEVNTFTCICDDGYTGKHCEEEIDECKRQNMTCFGILDATETRDNTLDMQAVLGGTIGTLAFLFLLMLAALIMVVVIRRQKKCSEFSSKCTNKFNNTPIGKHHALPSSTPEVVEKEETK